MWKAVPNCSESELLQLAKEFCAELSKGDWILLEGELGAGKTTFVRAVCDALGIGEAAEGSPTFALVHEYTAPRFDVAHIDFYRLKNETEIDEAGIPFYFWERNSTVVFSEWALLHLGFRQKLLNARSGHRVWLVTLDFSANPQVRSIRIEKT